MYVTWHNIPWQGMEYSLIQRGKKILGIFFDVAWNIHWDSFLLMLTYSFVHLLALLPNLIGDPNEVQPNLEVVFMT
jgi:hypothetical protein